MYDENNPCFRWVNFTFPTWYFIPIQVPTELPRTVFRTRGLQVGVRTDFVRVELLDLQCLTMTLAAHVVEDVSISGHSDF